MRKLVQLASMLFCCSTLFAADVTGDRWHISVLASEISSGSSDAWSKDPEAGLGIGIAYAPTPQWDIELTASTQSHVSPYARLLFASVGPDQPAQLIEVFEYREYDVRPLDVSVTRHLLAGQTIAPYVRAGVRYVAAPKDVQLTIVAGQFPAEPVVITEGFHLQDRTSAQAGAGLRVRLTPRTALRAEVNRLIRSDSADFDPLVRYALGVSWLF